jgi:hypothetical protein
MTKNSNSKKNISKLELIGYLFAFFSFTMAIHTFFFCKEDEALRFMLCNERGL